MAQKYLSARTIGRVVKADLARSHSSTGTIHLLNEATRVKRKANSKLVLK
ncbi:Hypothetical protein FKW44_020287 [Caligus rogercresseyi]|uniref:Uncharacterized protein n=1 Tax=Caligus rogercresseyi TaxID=217165 RepID=A0A7T8GXC0_CALRO|nr:Hypothetical protein FKW44_020287 [Caligus rogercresseyi]